MVLSALKTFLHWWKFYKKLWWRKWWRIFLLEVDIQYPEKLHGFHNYLPFLPERMKIEKVKKLVPNLHDKTEYVIYLRNLKQALNHGLVLKKGTWSD